MQVHLHCDVHVVCHSLLDICDITEQIDANITHGIWKSLMRYSIM